MGVATRRCLLRGPRGGRRRAAARAGEATVRPGARAAASLAVAVTDAFAVGVSAARAPRRRAACLSAQCLAAVGDDRALAGAWASARGGSDLPH